MLPSEHTRNAWVTGEKFMPNSIPRFVTSRSVSKRLDAWIAEFRSATRLDLGVRWEMSFPNGMIWCAEGHGKPRATASTPLITSRNSLENFARHLAKRAVFFL